MIPCRFKREVLTAGSKDAILEDLGKLVLTTQTCQNSFLGTYNLLKTLFVGGSLAQDYGLGVGLGILLVYKCLVAIIFVEEVYVREKGQV